jgi:hypothetical protein
MKEYYLITGLMPNKLHFVIGPLVLLLYRLGLPACNLNAPAEPVILRFASALVSCVLEEWMAQSTMKRNLSTRKTLRRMIHSQILMSI